MARRRRPPRTSIAPPAGTYDPALDAQRAAAQRGLFDLGQDVRTGNLRDITDYGLAREDIQRQSGQGLEDLTVGRDRALADYSRSHDRGMEDIGRGHDRGLEDIGLSHDRGHATLDKSLGRGTEDYQRNVGLLQRSFQQLARRQAEGSRQAGVLSGGIALKAAAKRAENEAIERQPLDTGFQRLGEDVATGKSQLSQDWARQAGRISQDWHTGAGRISQDWHAGTGRTQEDFGRQSGRLGQETESQLGRLALMGAPPDASNPFGGRSFQDRASQFARAQRENQAFGMDLDAQRYYQATGAGWVPPQPRRPRRR